MASVKNAWIRKYGEVEGLKMWDEQKKKYGIKKDELLKKYGSGYVEELSKKKNTFSLNGCIQKYGEVDGPKIWQDRLNTKLKNQKDNFKNKKWNNGRTLEEYQKRYGVEDGYNRWYKRNIRHSYMVSSQRYIDEFGENGKSIIREIKDNTSLDSFIKRYGDSAGPIKYAEYIEKCKNSSKRSINYWIKLCGNIDDAKKLLNDYQNNTSLDKFIKRYGDTDGRKKYLTAVCSATSHGFNAHSKISQKLFWELYNDLEQLNEKNTNFFELNAECNFFKNDKLIKVDFKYQNKIIEFNGDFWHANPLYYKKDDIIKETKASDIWQRDYNRNEWLKSAGYLILVIWENEYINYPKETLLKCKNFIINE